MGDTDSAQECGPSSQKVPGLALAEVQTVCPPRRLAGAAHRKPGTRTAGGDRSYPVYGAWGEPSLWITCWSGLFNCVSDSHISYLDHNNNMITQIDSCMRLLNRVGTFRVVWLWTQGTFAMECPLPTCPPAQSKETPSDSGLVLWGSG